MIRFKFYRWWLAWFGYKSYVKKGMGGEKSYAILNGKDARLDFKMGEMGFRREY